MSKYNTFALLNCQLTRWQAGIPRPCSSSALWRSNTRGCHKPLISLSHHQRSPPAPSYAFNCEVANKSLTVSNWKGGSIDSIASLCSSGVMSGFLNVALKPCMQISVVVGDCYQGQDERNQTKPTPQASTTAPTGARATETQWCFPNSCK